MKRLAPLALTLAALAGGIVAQENPLEDLAERWREFQDLPDEEKSSFLIERAEEVLRAGAAELPEPQRTQALQVADLLSALRSMSPEERRRILEGLGEEGLAPLRQAIPDELRRMAEGLQEQLDAVRRMSPDERRRMAERFLEGGREELENLLGRLAPFRDVKEEADRTRCKNNLRQLALGFVILRDQGDGRAPAFEGLFEELVDATDPEALRCPSAGPARGADDRVATSYETWSGGRMTMGQMARFGSVTPILWDQGGNHEGVRMVAFADGHVEELTEEDFARRIEEAAERCGFER